MRTSAIAVVLAAAVVARAAADRPAERRTVGVVSHVKVLSDKVEDVSSLEAWRKSFIRDSMTPKQKALACWETVVRFQHQDGPPKEFLQNEDTVLDAIKLFNVYGYSFCGVAASHVQSLARQAGLEARGWTIRAHVVPEVAWEDEWHMLDASLINYFPKADGKLASVAEIVAAVTDWLKANPGYKGNDAQLRKFHAAGGWTGWKKGPALLASCPFYDWGGWWPARTHGWYATMQEYDGSTLFPYECGYSQGYQVNIQLRPGERLTRNWSNKGLHVNMDGGGGAPGCLKPDSVKEFLRYTRRHGDLAPGRIGNGTMEYDVPLGDGSFRSAALRADNLACKAEDGAAPAVHVKDAAQPGVLEIRMPSSYVYLSGALSFQAAVGKGGEIRVLLSDNHGLDWKEAAAVAASGEQRVDLKPLVFRRYDYRIRFVMKGKGTGLDALKLSHDVQHSQRPLPALTQGRNTITFSAGPQEGTITIEGSTDPKNKPRQLICEDFHPQFNQVDPHLLRLKAGKGDITFAVKTPGEMMRLRFGCFYRARDARDGWDLQVSFDDGKTFRTAATAAGPKVFGAKWVTFSDVPAGTKAALVRYSGRQRNTACIFNFRIDADYAEPRGGFAPVRITYVWEEGGLEKRDVHVARTPAETYPVRCDSTPVMKSISLELAQ
jgi:hypothetical protein